MMAETSTDDRSKGLAPAGSRSGARSDRLRSWCVGAAVGLVALVPVVVVLIPSQIVVMDGGLHLASAAAFRGLLRGQWPGLVEWQTAVPPNLTVEMFIAWFVGFVDSNAVVRIVLVVALLGFAIASVLLVRAAGAPLWTVAFLLPLQMNATLMIGLLGFVVAVFLSIIVIAVTIRWPRRPRIALLTALLILVWVTHLIPAVAALVTAICIATCQKLTDGEKSPTVPEILRSLWAALAQLWIPVAVIVVLTAGFLFTGGTDGADIGNVGGPRVLDLTKPLVTLAPSEYLISRMVAVALYVAVIAILIVRVRALRGGYGKIEAADGLLVAGLGIGFVSTIAPEIVGSVGYTATRMSIYFPLLLGAWVATQVHRLRSTREQATDEHKRSRYVVAIAGVTCGLMALAFPLVRVAPLVSLGDDLAEMRSLAACAPVGSTIVELELDWGDGRAERILPMSNQVGNVAAERQLLDLSNISGSTSYYLWGFTERSRPVPLLSSSHNELSGVPPQVELGAAINRGYPLDSVLVYGRRDASDATLSDPRWLAVRNDLDSVFRRVAVGETGVSELWVRRGLASPCG